ncbi:SOS response-associated peptidase [Nitrospira sp. M1]
MCGRYTQTGKFDNLLKLLRVLRKPPLTPRYNIAPGQMVACVRHDPENDQRECVMLKWGLIPFWAEDPSLGQKLINARGETVAEKPSFRKSFQSRRCLVLADGFYEWKQEGTAKQPYYIRFKDHRPFVFAGLWERWAKIESPIQSCTIITTTPNVLMQPLYRRMPVILNTHDCHVWLDSTIQNPALLHPLLQPMDSEEMEAYPVSPLVNNPRNDVPACIAPAG